MSAPRSDTVARAITDDGAFRVIAAMCTTAVQGAVTAQKARGALGQSFGELITGAIVLREAMAPRLRVQAILKGAPGAGSMVADSHPDGTSRGLISFGAGKSAPAAGPSDGDGIPDGALLQVMRTLPSGSLHQGMVEVPAGGGISGALMQYMADSEQIVSTIAVSATVDGDHVRAAGGYMVQLLPEVERGPLMIMTERLAALPNLADVLLAPDVTPDVLLGELLYGMPYTRLEESPLSFGCNCSQVRVVASLATLPRSDVEELIRDGEVLEISCDYCGRQYHIAPVELRTLLTTN